MKNELKVMIKVRLKRLKSTAMWPFALFYSVVTASLFVSIIGLYASVNSKRQHPPPPRATPGVLHLLSARVSGSVPSE